MWDMRFVRVGRGNWAAEAGDGDGMGVERFRKVARDRGGWGLGWARFLVFVGMGEHLPNCC
jgi:hypothetical protein